MASSVNMFTAEADLASLILERASLSSSPGQPRRLECVRSGTEVYCLADRGLQGAGPASFVGASGAGQLLVSFPFASLTLKSKSGVQGTNVNGWRFWEGRKVGTRLCPLPDSSAPRVGATEERRRQADGIKVSLMHSSHPGVQGLLGGSWIVSWGL